MIIVLLYFQVTTSFSMNLSWSVKHLSDLDLGRLQEPSLPFPGNTCLCKHTHILVASFKDLPPSPVWLKWQLYVTRGLTALLGTDVDPDVVFSLVPLFPLSSWNQAVLPHFLSFSKYISITHCVSDYTRTCQQNRQGLFHSPVGSRQALIKSSHTELHF